MSKTENVLNQVGIRARLLQKINLFRFLDGRDDILWNYPTHEKKAAEYLDKYLKNKNVEVGS